VAVWKCIGTPSHICIPCFVVIRIYHNVFGDPPSLPPLSVDGGPGFMIICIPLGISYTYVGPNDYLSLYNNALYDPTQAFDWSKRKKILNIKTNQMAAKSERGKADVTALWLADVVWKCVEGPGEHGWYTLAQTVYLFGNVVDTCCVHSSRPGW